MNINRPYLATLAILVAGLACTTKSSSTADTSTANVPAPAAAPGPVDSAAAVAPQTTASATGMMDPNAATATDLATVPGVTAEVAQAIVAGRPYADNLAVDKVLPKSLTDQQRDSVYAHMWIPLDLNKASKQEILLIPGVGPRMQREFLEYRPYASIEEFRREIGKYVDKDEVARLERYVKI